MTVILFYADVQTGGRGAGDSESNAGTACI